ncbi:solute carrier family 22 member 18 [Lampris incognitus]|uniref:solute carrier family 22 member 18 n=1 Tax=Lampris incognitus TaxID=2546036 RepID=UPI0024B542F2|nr:solute carrier family 22 member 18 [Lampris incognitus]
MGEGGKEMSGKPAIVSQQEKRIIHIIYLIVVMDVTWMFMQFSILPYLARSLGFDTLWFGYLRTMVGVIQLLGGPVFGRFADVFGARAALSLACVASIVFYLLLAIADSPAMLFIHKLPTVLMHILPGSRMVVSDLTEPQHRADALAKLGLCFAVGMITGSTLGGTLSTHYGKTFASCFAAAGNVISLILVVKFVPKSTKAQDPQDNTDSVKSKKSVFNLGEITRLMKFPGVTRTFLVKIVSGLPEGIFQVMFSIIAMNFFKLEPEQNGYLMAYFGIVQMVIQGGVIGRLTALYSESSLLLLSIGVSSLVGLAEAFMQNVFHFCFIVIPMMFSFSMFNIITDSMLTKSVPSSDTGTMLGLCSSAQSLLHTIAPTLGGFLYENYGVPSFGLIQFAVNITVFVYLIRRGFKHQVEHKE